MATEADSVLGPIVIMSSQGTVGERDVGQVRQFVVLVVHHAPVEAIGKPSDLGVGNPLGDLLDDLFTFAPDDHIDVRTAAEEVLDLFRRFAAADDRGDLRRQLGNEIAEPLESGVPLDPDAQQIDLLSDETAQDLWILVFLRVTQIQKSDLVHESLETGGYVFQARGGKHPHRGRRVAEAGIQH
jgi:hypothetical protein